MTLFIDSSAFYAAADDNDMRHSRAKGALSSDDALVTSDHVLVESWLLMHRRLGRTAANSFWEQLRAGVVDIEPVGSSDLESAWAIAQAFPDQDFSIVDLTSFAVMQRLGVHRVATFDSDFAVFRFGPRRERAFEIVA